MKKLITILFLVTAIIAKSQIQVGSADFPQGNRSGKLSPENIGKLKSLFTTIFILQTGDSLRKAEFENAISQVWTVNKFKVILPHEQIQYANRTDCAFASFGGYKKYIGNLEAYNLHVFYDLKLPQFNKKGEIEYWLMISRIGLFPEDDWWEKLHNSKEFDKKESESEEISKLLPTLIHFKNWSPGFIKGYFKRINDLIIKGKTNGFYSEYIDLDNVKKLTNDTLYLPEYIKEDKDKKSQLEWITFLKEKSLKTDNLPYFITFIEQSKLDSLILLRKEKFYYLTHIQSSTDKFVSIFEGTTGNMLYSKYSPASYKFKIKDLKKIAEAIDK
ncbi:MAG: hypothetical protein ACOYMA_03850 [Bacteroidia bacterium]